MQGADQTVDVARRGAESDAGPDGAWEGRAPPGLEFGAEAVELGVGDSEQARDEWVRAEAAVADADRVLGAEDGREQRVAVAVEGERRHADTVGAGPARAAAVAGPGHAAARSTGRAPARARVRRRCPCRSRAAAGTPPRARRRRRRSGEPASWRSGRSAQCTSSRVTSLTAPPPRSSGAPAASRRRSPTSAPAPNGRVELVAREREVVDAHAGHVDRAVRRELRGIDAQLGAVVVRELGRARRPARSRR